jgi:hypothetical protein
MKAPSAVECTLPAEEWQIIIQEKKICKDLHNRIKDHISQQLIQPLWDKKKRIPTSSFPNMAWTSIATAMSALPSTRRHWITKHAAQCCGVNTVLFKWKQKDSPGCPRCGELETTTHVLRCHHLEVQSLWDTTLSALDDWLKDAHTDVSIRNALIHNLRRWYHDTPLPINRTPLEQAQDDIGWDFVLEGCLSSQWAEHQSLYLQSLGKKTSGYRWLTALIRKLWDIAWDLWEHRNGIEHHNDQAKLCAAFDKQIQQELQIGFDDLPFHKYGELYSSHEIEKLGSSTAEYKRCWIKHIVAARRKEAHQPLEDTGQLRMRSLMRRYLGLSP